MPGFNVLALLCGDVKCNWCESDFVSHDTWRSTHCLIVLRERYIHLIIFSNCVTFLQQVSFSGNRASGTYTPLVVSGSSPPRGEPISLATLDRDCFIIPLASLERFLPAGVPVSYLTLQFRLMCYTPSYKENTTSCVPHCVCQNCSGQGIGLRFLPSCDLASQSKPNV